MGDHFMDPTRNRNKYNTRAPRQIQQNSIRGLDEIGKIADSR